MTARGSDGHDAPVVVAGEIATTLAFLGYLRDAVVRKLDGLTEEQARRRVVASGTTLLGLVKHLTFVEDYWVQRRFAGRDLVLADDGFALAPQDTIASVRRAYVEATLRTDDVVTSCGDPEHPLERSTHGLTLRWLLAHLSEETARHAGHADIVREILDGTAGR